jgi:hypothetical protein
MELRYLQTFKTLAAELSFTRTAERLSYAQSSVTAQIQALEREFGVQLFERLGKQVVPVQPNGHTLLSFPPPMFPFVTSTAVNEKPPPVPPQIWRQLARLLIWFCVQKIWRIEATRVRTAVQTQWPK